MKATGIVRRIDDLGRIVVPLKIRKILRIQEGDALEIFIDEEGILFKKFSQVKELGNYATEYAKVLQQTSGNTILIVDMNCVISASSYKNQYATRKISSSLEKIILDKKTVLLKDEVNMINPIEIFDGDTIDYVSQIISPIILNGDISGAIIMFSEKEELTEFDRRLTELSSTYLSNQINL